LTRQGDFHRNRGRKEEVSSRELPAQQKLKMGGGEEIVSVVSFGVAGLTMTTAFVRGERDAEEETHKQTRVPEKRKYQKVRTSGFSSIKCSVQSIIRSGKTELNGVTARTGEKKDHQ